VQVEREVLGLPQGDPTGGGVFISYSGEDSLGYGPLLYSELSRRFGSGLVFMDSESIPRRSRLRRAPAGPSATLPGAARGGDRRMPRVVRNQSLRGLPQPPLGRGHRIVARRQRLDGGDRRVAVVLFLLELLGEPAAVDVGKDLLEVGLHGLPVDPERALETPERGRVPVPEHGAKDPFSANAWNMRAISPDMYSSSTMASGDSPASTPTSKASCSAVPSQEP
jgi:hypothetical protein